MENEIMREEINEEIIEEEIVSEEPASADNQPKKKAGKGGAIFWGVLFMTIYIVIGSIPQLFALIPILTSALTEAAGDMSKYQELYLSKLSESANAISTATFIGTTIAATVMVIWYIFRVYKKEVKAGEYESVLPKLKSVKSILFLISITMTGLCVAILVEKFAFFLMPNFKDAFNSAMSSVIGGNDILGFILTVAIAPIGEETCLRGLALNRTSKTFGLVGCMIYSGIMFGIFHLNPIQGLYAIPIGLCLGYVAYKYKSVIPCILMHALNNLIGGFSETFRFDTWYVPAILAAVFGVIMIVIGSKIDFLKKEQPAQNQQVEAVE